MKNLTLLITIMFSWNIFAQDLMVERIRKLTGTKKSIYFDSGIFHNGSPNTKSKLTRVRHSFIKKNGYERIVLDFSSSTLPRVYGHIAGKDRRLYLDLFKTDLDRGVGSFGDSEFVESINFFPIDKESLSVELMYKKKVNVEVFYLNSPARLVIDLRG